MEDRVKNELRRLREIIAKERIAFTNMCDVETTQIGYDARAQDYSDEISRRPDKIRQIREMNFFYLKNLTGILEGKKVDWLDAGCADGLRTRLFYDHLNLVCGDVNLKALDYSPGMVEQARKVLGKEKVNWGDVTNLPFENEFDLITCIYGVLGHVPEEAVPAAFESLNKSLKEGGLLCTDIFVKDCERLRKRGYSEETGNCGNYMAYFVRMGDEFISNGQGLPLVYTQRMFSSEEIEGHIQKAGFKIVAEKLISGSDPKKFQSKVDRERTFILQK